MNYNFLINLNNYIHNKPITTYRYIYNYIKTITNVNNGQIIRDFFENSYYGGRLDYNYVTRKITLKPL